MGMPTVNSCSGGSYSSKADAYTPPEPPNPNPERFTIEELWVSNRHSIMMVRYHDCTNYEGRKILVYPCIISKPQILTRLDPHFQDGVEFSPIARFVPTKLGMEFAKEFVRCVETNFIMKELMSLRIGNETD